MIPMRVLLLMLLGNGLVDCEIRNVTVCFSGLEIDETPLNERSKLNIHIGTKSAHLYNSEIPESLPYNLHTNSPNCLPTFQCDANDKEFAFKYAVFEYKYNTKSYDRISSWSRQYRCKSKSGKGVHKGGCKNTDDCREYKIRWEATNIPVPKLSPLYRKYVTTTTTTTTRPTPRRTIASTVMTTEPNTEQTTTIKNPTTTSTTTKKPPKTEATTTTTTTQEPTTKTTTTEEPTIKTTTTEEPTIKTTTTEEPTTKTTTTEEPTTKTTTTEEPTTKTTTTEEPTTKTTTTEDKTTKTTTTTTEEEKTERTTESRTQNATTEQTDRVTYIIELCVSSVELKFDGMKEPAAPKLPRDLTLHLYDTRSKRTIIRPVVESHNRIQAKKRNAACFSVKETDKGMNRFAGTHKLGVYATKRDIFRPVTPIHCYSTGDKSRFAVQFITTDEPCIGKKYCSHVLVKYLCKYGIVG